MATLEKIRSRGTLLLIVVGLALASFIVGDFINSGSTFFQQNANNVAQINGDKVPAMDYMKSIEEMQSVYEMELGATSLNEETTQQIRESVWETTVRNSVIATEAAKIGMQVTNAELVDMTVGNKISQIISSRRMFLNENGMFDVSNLKQFISVVYSDEENQIPMTEKLKYRAYWEFWEKMVKTSRLEAKYMDLINEAVVVTPLEAKYAFDAKAKSYNVVFAMKNYYTVADSTIAVSDAELSELYAKNKEQYKQDANAEINYVVFDIKPSKDDYAKVAQDMNSMKNEFSTTKDIASFTNAVSDVAYAGINMTKEDVDADFAEFAFTAAIDSVMGPIFVNDTYKMARVVATGMELPDSVKLNNIAIARETKEETQALADSLMQAIDAGADFAALAKEFSLAQNAENGGEIGWVRENELPKDVAEKAFVAKSKSYFRTEDGAAIVLFNVEELGEKVDKVKLAVVSLSVTASSQTRAQIYGDAKAFAAESNNQLATFEAVAAEKKMQVLNAKNIDINARTVNDIPQAREIVRWTFENDANAVSDVIECEDKLVVAAVVANNEKGYKTVEDVKSILTAEVIKAKKGKMLAAEMEGKSIDVLKAEGYQVDTAKNVNFASAYVMEIGNEPAMFAGVANMKEGELSKPVAGKAGAYVYMVVSTTENPAVFDEKAEMTLLSNQQRYMYTNLMIEALKTSAKIEDTRYKFF